MLLLPCQIRPEEVDLRAETNPEPGRGSLSRIIALFSHVLLQLYRKTDRVEAARASPQKPVATLAKLGAMVRTKTVEAGRGGDAWSCVGVEFGVGEEEIYDPAN